MTESSPVREKSPTADEEAKQGQRESLDRSEQSLLISTLKESLEMQKQIIERIQAEKEEVEEELGQVKSHSGKHMEQMGAQLAHLTQERDMAIQNCRRIQTDLEKQRLASSRIESNFYEHVRSIRAVDADNSTIQSGINGVLGGINRLCNKLKPSINFNKATAFVFERWPEQEQNKPNFCGPAQDGDIKLNAASCGLFAEKLIMDTLVDRVLKQPIHLGVSVNDSFHALATWMETRNPAWALRLRQQAVALAARLEDSDEEQANVAAEKENVVNILCELLSNIYTDSDEEKQKQLENVKREKLNDIVERARKVDFAMKSQDAPIQIVTFAEGKDEFDKSKMKAVGSAPWKEEGVVRLVIAPLFMASGDMDVDTIIVPAKVLCM